MADKELPPLRVKLIGDDKSFRQMIARVSDSLTRLESRKITVNLTNAVADAAALVDKLNSVNMSVAFKQITDTRGVLRSLASVKLTALDTEVNNIAKKFEKIDQAVKRIQQVSINSALSGGGMFGKISGIISGVKGMFGKGAPATSATAGTPSPSATAVMNPAQIKAVGESTAKRIKAEADAAARKSKAASDATTAQIKASGDAAAKQKKASGDAAATQIKAAGDAAVKQTKAAADAAARQTKAAADAAATQVKAAADAAATTRMSAANAAAVNRKAAAAEAVMKRKAMADVAAIQLKAAATAAGIQRKAAADAAAITTKAAAVAAATTATAAATAPAKAAAVTTKAAATAAATTTRAAATAAATQTRAAATAAATQARADNNTRLANSRIRQANNKNWRDEEAHRQKMRIADEIHQKRMRSKYYTTHPPAAKQPSAGGGGGLGQGLTSRADIYMHANAMRALTQSGKGLIDLRANLQFAEVGIRAFTGDAGKASQVMQEIKDHAEKTSFTRLGLSEATRNMMAYGMSAKDAISNIKMLGDVAGGNELRFERLSFAMSQITSMGRLQGQELRQLTEQGFNPLETMSRYTGKSMLELKQLMEDGAITSEHVTEALKIETSAGGRFANMQKEMANSLGGVRSQLFEVGQNLKVHFITIMEGELIAAMKTAISYLKQFERYLQTPQGQIFANRVVQIAKNVFVAVLAFHAIGFAMASFMWFLQSTYSTAMRLFSVFRLITTGISILVAVVSSPFYLVIAGALAAVAAIMYFSGAINGPTSLYSAFLDVWDITSAFFSRVVGFFYNFGDNWATLSAWFGRNWKNILGDMMEGAVRFAFAMIGNMQVMLRMIGRLFVVFFTWLLTSYQNLFSGDLYNAMVDGFVRVFTWLEDKWKKFGDFVGKIWENLFDPGALYEVLMEGMGINETASKMTDDIATTMEKGLFAGINNVVKDEMANMRTGFEDFKPTTEAMPDLKLSTPTLPPTPAEPQLPDAQKYTGKGFAGFGGGKDYKATEAMSASGSAYNKLLAEQAERMRSLRASPKQNPQVQQQVITNNLLKQLIQITGGTPNVVLQAAGVSTP